MDACMRKLLFANKRGGDIRSRMEQSALSQVWKYWLWPFMLYFLDSLMSQQGQERSVELQEAQCLPRSVLRMDDLSSDCRDGRVDSIWTPHISTLPTSETFESWPLVAQVPQQEF